MREPTVVRRRQSTSLQRRAVLRAGAAAASGALLAACGAPGGTSSSGGGGGAGAGATKKEYVIAPPLGRLEQLVGTINRATPMADFLAREAGLPMKAFAPGDYAGTIIGLREGTLDFGFLPAVLYLRAHDDSGAQSLFRTLRPGADNKPTPTFTSIIAVRTDSGLGGLSDLIGKRLVAVDVSDAAGWVLPAAHLKKNGIDPSKDVKVEYRKDGPDALIQVLTKKADVAFAARQDAGNADVLKADPEVASTLKTLATIEGAPLEVLAFRQGLDSKVVDKFKAAFRSLGEGQKAMVTDKDGKTMSILGQWGISGLVETKDADFAALREAARAIGIRLK